MTTETDSKIVIKSWISGNVLFETTAPDLKSAVEQAVKVGAYLGGANLRGATVLGTGETWDQYRNELVPALLTAGGKALSDVFTPEVWACHDMPPGRESRCVMPCVPSKEAARA